LVRPQLNKGNFWYAHHSPFFQVIQPKAIVFLMSTASSRSSPCPPLHIHSSKSFTTYAACPKVLGLVESPGCWELMVSWAICRSV